MTNNLPSKKDILWAIENDDSQDIQIAVKASDILRQITGTIHWTEFGWHKCPLCGYENDTTNVHRHCPQAPFDLKTPTNILPQYLRRMAVPMYYVRDFECI